MPWQYCRIEPNAVGDKPITQLMVYALAALSQNRLAAL